MSGAAEKHARGLLADGAREERVRCHHARQYHGGQWPSKANIFFSNSILIEINNQLINLTQRRRKRKNATTIGRESRANRNRMAK